MKPTLEEVLLELYKHEINCLVYSEWDAGWTVKLGDPMNGYTETAVFEGEDVGEIGLWLIKAVKVVYPNARLFTENGCYTKEEVEKIKENIRNVANKS